MRPEELCFRIVRLCVRACVLKRSHSPAILLSTSRPSSSKFHPIFGDQRQKREAKVSQPVGIWSYSALLTVGYCTFTVAIACATFTLFGHDRLEQTAAGLWPLDPKNNFIMTIYTKILGLI